MRRRIREAYRLNRDIFLPILKQNSLSVNIAIIYMHDNICDYALVEEKLKNALTSLAEIIADYKHQ